MFHSKHKKTFDSGDRKLFLLLASLIIFILAPVSFAQWISNPAINTELAIEMVDPINISAVEDKNGGAFVFWQDNKYGFQNEIYFMHVNESGKISFRADGKKITKLSGQEENPICTASLPNSAVVIWKDYTRSKSGNLLAQRVSFNGTFLWQDYGVVVSDSKDEISDYSVDADNSGNTFIAYVAKEPEITGDYKIVIKKFSTEGKEIFIHDGISLNKSRVKKNITSIIADDEGGAFVFWLEVINEKVILFGQHINPEGKEIWGNKPIEISSKVHNVLNYFVTKAGSSIYAAWQTQRIDRVIYHQLISDKGKPLWVPGGKLITNLKGNQVNPVAVFVDSTMILSWTNEYGKEKEIYLQRFDKRGKPVWNKSGIPITNFRSVQFGQHLISDGKDGVILAWVDSRSDSTYADIYSQRFDKNGKMMWSPLGLAVATNFNTPKSYLNLVPDGRGGAIAVFKNRRNSINKIYGQKVFNMGAFVSQISQFNAGVQNDSIKISWDVSNERGKSFYSIERAVESDTGEMMWKTVGTIRSNGESNNKSFQYFDVPDTTGTLYYRVEQTDAAGNIQPSDVTRINYFGEASDIIVMQNSPNPFSDSTDISFYLPKTSRVTIEFYNSHVAMISQIDDKTFPSGENHIQFSAQGLKPGIYFYRFMADNFVDVKKMVITN
ncbi:MAG: T9SS type A sorting domain-containing protein [Ignavibacteriaceae bacterium]